MIREISTLTAVIIIIAITTYLFLPAIYQGYNRLSNLGVLPNTAGYNILNQFIGFIISNIHWFIILFSIIIFLVYVSTKSSFPWSG